MRYLITILALFGFLVPLASAQFPGDVYFDVPSQSALEGGSVDVEVLTFSGANAFGALHFSLEYDPTVIELAGSPSSVLGEVRVGSRATEGRVGLVCSNSVGSDTPFGVVRLMVLTFDVVGAAGTTTTLDLTSLGAVSLAGLSLNSNAFDGNIIIVSPLTEDVQGDGEGAFAATTTATLSPRLAHEATRFAPPGAMLTVVSAHRTPFGWAEAKWVTQLPSYARFVDQVPVTSLSGRPVLQGTAAHGDSGARGAGESIQE